MIGRAMTAENFFSRPAPLSLSDLISIVSVTVPSDADRLVLIADVAPLDRAAPSELSFFDNPKYRDQLIATKAGFCLVAHRFRDLVPAQTVALVSASPYSDFARIAAHFYPSAMVLGSAFLTSGISPSAIIHPDAKVEDGVTIDPGVVIGPFAHIGAGTLLAANTVIGPHVRIGRHCQIGSNCSITHALIGNQVTIHGGCRIGQDGFGFAIGRSSHLKVPQLGRVILQDHVDLGANVCIDRGTVRDTVIGEGTKIDNLGQIGHNVVIGRHCLIAGQVGIAGSTVLEDFVIVGGKVGMNGHIRIGEGSQIAGGSNIVDNLVARSKVGGSPARPIKEWFRQIAILDRLIRDKKMTSALMISGGDKDGRDGGVE